MDLQRFVRDSVQPLQVLEVSLRIRLVLNFGLLHKILLLAVVGVAPNATPGGRATPCSAPTGPLLHGSCERPLIAQKDSQAGKNNIKTTGPAVPHQPPLLGKFSCLDLLRA